MPATIRIRTPRHTFTPNTRLCVTVQVGNKNFYSSALPEPVPLVDIQVAGNNYKSSALPAPVKAIKTIKK